MLDMYFIASLLLFSVLCLLEVIVFNEEILLALCFFSFIFFLFNTASGSVADMFNDRAAKFESDLLLSFALTKDNLVKQFETHTLARNFVSQFKVLHLNFSTFLSVFPKHSSYKLSATFSTTCFNKLAELVAFENKLFTDLKKKAISSLLYPLIFQTTSNNISFLTKLSSVAKKSSTSTKISILKQLSV